MKSIILFSIIVSLAASTALAQRSRNSQQGSVNCDVKSNDKIDSQMAKILVIGEYGRVYPENTKELKPFCDESKSLAKSLEEYKNKCFKGTLKQFGSLMIYSVRNSVKQFCAKNNRRIQDLLKTAVCVNQNRPQVNQCMTNLINKFMGIKYAPDAKKIPFTCCEYVNFVGCISKVFERSEGCRDKLDLALDFLRNIMGNVIDSSCGEYTDDSDKCGKLGTPPKKKASDKPAKSILYPLYDIINSIPE